MAEKNPVMELQKQFSSEDAKPTAWSDARGQMEKAEIYWLTTVRPDGHPHTTPLVGVWLDGAMYFCTGPTERKAKNLEHNSHCIIMTGCNSLSEGLDIVVEGDAVVVHDEALLQRLAAAYASKYEPPFHFTVRDGAFDGDGGLAPVYRITPAEVFGFGKGKSFSQTRWRF